MPSTSFQSRQVGCSDSFHANSNTDSHAVPADPQLPGSALTYITEVRRMKAFEGQRKFRAPVADDFCRGLLPAVNTDLTTKRAGGALSSLLGGLKVLWRGHQAD